MPTFYKCQECLRTVPTFSKLQGITTATSGHHHGNSVHNHRFLRASSATLCCIIKLPLRGWSKRSPSNKNNKVYIKGGLRGTPSCPSQCQIRALRGHPAALLINQARSDFLIIVYGTFILLKDVFWNLIGHDYNPNKENQF